MKWFLIILFITPFAMAQKLTNHTWKERVIVITSDASEKDLAAQQLTRFLAMEEEMKDRQLVLYYCVENECTYYDFQTKAKPVLRDAAGTAFKTRLYGLDGQMKYESNDLISPQVIFALIDKMPMRRSEMRKRIKNNGGI